MCSCIYTCKVFRLSLTPLVATAIAFVSLLVCSQSGRDPVFDVVVASCLTFRLEAGGRSSSTTIDGLCDD